MKLPGKILLVDDEVHIRKYVGLILKGLGVGTIIEAANGEEALAQYQEHRPELVLLDVNMPRMDGIETLRRLREIDASALVVMLTSLATRQIVEQAFELGAENYIRKDTPKDEIARALTETFAECLPETPAP